MEERQSEKEDIYVRNKKRMSSRKISMKLILFYMCEKENANYNGLGTVLFDLFSAFQIPEKVFPVL